MGQSEFTKTMTCTAFTLACLPICSTDSQQMCQLYGRLRKKNDRSWWHGECLEQID